MSEPPRLQKVGTITREKTTTDADGKVLKETTKISAEYITYHDLQIQKKKKLPFKMSIWRLTQSIMPPLRDGAFYDYRNIKKMHNLMFKIKTRTFWLASPTIKGDKEHFLPFHEQVSKYYEYLDMKAKFYLVVAIFLFTVFQVYLVFR